MRPLPLLLVLAACAGDRVKVDGLDRFDVRSEVWLEEDSALGPLAYLVLTNVEDACDKYRAAREAYDAMVAVEAGDETFCRDVKEVTQAWARAESELTYDGAHYLLLIPTEDGTPADLAVGDWGGDSTAHALVGTLTYVDQDYYASYLEDWDEDAAEIDRCGVTSMNELGPLPTRDLEDGLLIVDTLAEGDAVSGVFEGTFAALEEDAPIAVEATYDAAWCGLEG